MSAGVRIFIVDDEVKPFSYKKFLAMVLHHDTSIRLPQYAGRHLKYAMVFVENENRKPIEILRIECGYLNLDNKGRIDLKKLDEGMRDAMESLATYSESLLVDGVDQKNVINAKRHFIKRRNLAKYHWTPTRDELRQIYELIFKTSNRE
ncbi:MAG: hypothetical protein ACM3SR_09515 [Ignavibacteriales bacterium]|jgi:hypothetical protein